MKRSLLFTLCILYVLATHAQGWLPMGTKMYSEISSFGYRKVTTYNMIRYQTIHGKVCNLFQSRSQAVDASFSPPLIFDPSDEPNEYLYEEDRKVYYLNRDSTFVMLFDFAANVGDHWMNPTYSLNDPDSNYVEIVYTGDTVIDLMPHHFIKLRYSAIGIEFGIEQLVIEDIGSLGYPFLLPYADGLACEYAQLNCFENSVESHKFVQGPCEIETGISEFNLSDLQIYPNPAVDMLSISGVKTLQQLQLVDVNGRIIRFLELQSGYNVIDIGDLAKGSYWLQSSDNSVGEGRMIVKE